MIDMSKLVEQDVGREVIYHSSGGDKTEHGIISSWNDKYIFVKYERYMYRWCGKEPRYQVTAAATSPEDLTFAPMVLRGATP
jgi:hypothetical protein